MKPRTSNPFRPHLFTLAALVAAPFAHAVDGTWNGISGNWTDTTDPGGVWFGGTVADGIDSTANFTGIDIATDLSIALNGNRTIGNITFTDATTSSNNLAITGNILTLDRTNPGVPVIDVTQAGRTLTIGSVVAGNDGLQKNGTGNLTLTGTNTLTGTTTISGGTLQIGGGGATGSLYSPTVIGAKEGET